MGHLILAASSSKSSSSSTFLLILVVLVVLFYFVMIRPQSRKRRQAMEQQRQVQPGQRVRTTAGMYATVVAVEDDDVILEVAPGIEVRYLKRAIAEVLPDGSTEYAAYSGEPFTGDEDAPAADDGIGDETEDEGAEDDEAPEHADDEVQAHLDDASPNGSVPAGAEGGRTSDSA
jgi:preprotein translocase subunit YajC